MICASSRMLMADLVINAKNMLVRDDSGGADLEFLRTVIRRIDQLARRSGCGRQELRLRFETGAPEWKILRHGKERIVFVPGTSKEWNNSFELRRKLYRVIFTARFNLPEPGIIRALPVWMTAGTDEAIRARKHEEKYISVNRDYSVLRRMMKLTGKLPDFTVLCSFSALPEDPASRKLFDQMSRLLLEITASQKTIQRIIEEHNSGLPPENWLNNYSSLREARMQLNDQALKLLWNRQYPLPAAMRLARLKTLDTVLLPELDRRQTPTGQMKECSFAEANALLLTERRPDIREIRNYYSQQCLRFGVGSSPAVWESCAKLAAIAGQIGDNDKLPGEFRQELASLGKLLKQEADREQHCQRLFFTHLPSYTLYRYNFSVAGLHARQFMGTQTGELLNKTAEKYLENY